MKEEDKEKRETTLDEMYQERCPKHNTPLNSTKISLKCHACYEDSHANKQGYKCQFCDFYVHEECINTDIPSRHKHPLKLTSSHRGFELCCLCERNGLALLYQCSLCVFCICIQCTRKPLIFNQAKTHKHELHQVPMKLSFTCDACGSCTTSCSSDYPCICHQCCFKVHRKCIYLPRVIYINRHDHHISHISSLGPLKWICGVCHEPVNGDCGAYSCLTCLYVVHSMCAIRIDIWDGRELEGIPEEEEEGKPFEVIDENLIKHFRHQHNLKASLGLEEDKHCYVCTLPLNSEKYYKCTQCDFILDDACANLPLRKRHPISNHKLTLYVNVQRANCFVCDACLRYCTGFSYTGNFDIDVKCASITDAFKHESHPHFLFPFTSDRTGTRCNICDSLHWMHLRCINQDDCGGFNLCFTCATLPTEVRHKYDDHTLSLCYAEGNVNSTYCCGVCEDKIYPKSGFYWCSDCDSTLHTKCTYKNLLHPRPGYSLIIRDKGTFDLLPNDGLSRPTCYLCKTRCLGDLVLNNKADPRIFICSFCGFREIKLG